MITPEEYRMWGVLKERELASLHITQTGVLSKHNKEEPQCSSNPSFLVCDCLPRKESLCVQVMQQHHFCSCRAASWGLGTALDVQNCIWDWGMNTYGEDFVAGIITVPWLCSIQRTGLGGWIQCSAEHCWNIPFYTFYSTDDWTLHPTHQSHVLGMDVAYLPI